MTATHDTHPSSRREALGTMCAFLAATTMLGSLAGCRKRDSEKAEGAGSVRIVALSPAAAVMVRDLGEANAIVGRHGYDRMLPSSLPVCGNQFGIDYERLIATKPTHVITELGEAGVPPKLRELAQSRNWKLLDIRMRTLAEIRSELVRVDQWIRPPDSGEGPSPKARELLAQMDAAWNVRGSGFKNAGRVLMLAEVANPAALGPGSFHHELLLAVGGEPAITSGGPYQEIGLERVKELTPDVIVLVLPADVDVNESTADRPRVHADDVALARLGKIGTLSIPAVANRRVALLDHPFGQLPGTSMIEFANDLAEALGRFNSPS